MLDSWKALPQVLGEVFHPEGGGGGDPLLWFLPPTSVTHWKDLIVLIKFHKLAEYSATSIIQPLCPHIHMGIPDK